MEILDMPRTDVLESDAVPNLEDVEMDRIAFELWQHGSLPELAETIEADVEEVAAHASCL